MASTVLVVDDSAFMRNLLKQLLDGEHEVVGEAENGVEAVELYRELDPDVVTMDVVMPIRNGIEATTEIKSLDANASVIMCTSVGQEEKMREAVEAGADGYITKPFQKPNVLQAIDDVVSVEA
ncbi:two-component system, chemotaxis family, response regulator CheY [Halogeometricum rufum]|jgi:two-component system chemotaxis response regulator CheY|uniref:Two-component system, chemotaxis family, response regulator CheY n=2 Tax=Halogeometricum TaxID=60846 RepID=A0A1I6GP96_9EURY|nr:MULTISPECIES: chemotaxis protein CheY [Halogeometricum]MUV58416.1 response regulator [Halogeometricum sp. CBA1124]SFR43941.1 two-component system, chemotaxis family, response regulator CheY [Halogeometricum limi]SFR44974.1 two-component system, chemotaxis family, response regulator CheY [Halogeometricum rufum]